MPRKQFTKITFDLANKNTHTDLVSKATNSTVNSIYTFKYEQPDEYRFSHDSVFLSQNIAEQLVLANHQPSCVLDLCAGCGIVGLDLFFHLEQTTLKLPHQIDFVEVQNIYANYFVKNVLALQSLIKKPFNYNFINLNYEKLLSPAYQNKYDLIVSNPPYFRKEHGIQSASEFKNRCRFFLDSSYANLIKTIEHTLTTDGLAYILLKDLTEHGINIENEFYNLTNELNLKKLGMIRDTGFYLMTHKSKVP